MSDVEMNRRAKHRFWNATQIVGRTIGTGLVAIAIFFGVPPGLANAIEIPVQGFTDFIAEMIRKGAPRAEVRVVGPLHLTVKAADGDHDAYLDTIYSSCSRNPDGCAAVMQAFVENASASYAEPPPPLDRKSLRVAVRPEGYVEEMRSVMARHGGPPTVALSGGYWVTVVADQPTAIRYITGDELRGLGLSVDEGLALGKRNMAASMRREIKVVLASDRHSVGLISGSSYASSLFAFPELWAPVAAAFDGKLLVAVPASDVVLCGDGAVSGMAEKMADTARDVMAKDERPFSATLFQWSPDGWRPLPPSAKRR